MALKRLRLNKQFVPGSSTSIAVSLLFGGIVGGDRYLNVVVEACIWTFELHGLQPPARSRVSFKTLWDAVISRIPTPQPDNKH
jgi:hypothetical protein